jgi:hypothetical protein
VVDQIRKLARDPELARQVFEEASRQQKKLIPKLEGERKRLLKDKQDQGRGDQAVEDPCQGAGGGYRVMRTISGDW